MRSDSYRSSSPDAWEINTEPGGTTNSNNTTVKDHALGVIALILSVAAAVIVFMNDHDQQRIDEKNAQLIDAKVKAGVADALAQAHVAETKALVTERDLSILRDALKDKGIAIPPKD